VEARVSRAAATMVLNCMMVGVGWLG